MRGRHFDVIVTGLGLPSLVAASVLARRDFSVLLLGDGARPSSYYLDDWTLRRRSFSLAAGGRCPALRRALAELSQSQAFGRKIRPREPLGLLLPGQRLELGATERERAPELAREAPELARVVEDLAERLAELDAALDERLSGDVTIPPGTFFERRRVDLALATLPARTSDPLDELPPYHPLRGALRDAARFAAHAEGKLPGLAVARLLGSILLRPIEFVGSEDDARQFFVDRLLAYGGVVLPDEEVASVLADARGVRGAALRGEVREVGARFLVHRGTGESLARASGGEGVLAAARRSWPEVTRGTPRFVTSVVVERVALPELLPRESLFFATDPARTDPFRPPLLVQRSDDAPPGEALLIVEMLLPAEVRVEDARALTLSGLVGQLPFLERRLRVVDSPHDGRPAWVYEGGQRRLVDRLRLKGGTVHAEPMETLVASDASSFDGLAVEPVRGPIERTFLIGPSVLPTLGLEGELLAAESAASLITKADPNRRKMRIDLFGRVELG